MTRGDAIDVDRSGVYLDLLLAKRDVANDAQARSLVGSGVLEIFRFQDVFVFLAGASSFLSSQCFVVDLGRHVVCYAFLRVDEKSQLATETWAPGIRRRGA